ncbi:hypothetical protein GCM10023144_01710 [Pigmentiphaga soli]|uniref:Helix-turn-helix domain-containing protein n=1 Tax=Pigmentiphaga soli TaxID=1007095 RepID=A0ABP8GCY7_9BURK
MSQRDLIDIRAVADMLGGLNPDHVRDRVVRRPDFPRPFRIGNRILFDRPEVAEWIEAQRQAPDGRRTPKLRHASPQGA